MAVAVTYASNITVIETLADTYVKSTANTVTFNGMDTAVTLNSGSAVPATKHASQRVTMSSGAATIDLRALTGANGGAVDGNGLKVQLAKFRNLAANANAITIGEGASSGYELMGNAWTVTLQPGQEITVYGKEQAPDIGSSAKNIDIAGTGSQILEVQFVMG